MTTIAWGAILAKIADDIKANRSPPTPIDAGNLADTLSKINAALPSAILTLRAHQGVITGAADLLAALSTAGVPYAADIEAGLLGVPGALDAADKWLPTVIWALSESQPAPAWQPGPEPYRR